MPGVTVTLAGQGQKARVVTGDDGRFRFEGLPPGKYNISLSKAGYAHYGGLTALEVRAGGCAFSTEILTVDRRIVGRVTGADGRPAANISVVAVPSRPTQWEALPVSVAEAKTDGRGHYELQHLRPGPYYVGVNLARTPSKEMPYTRYFYPGTEEPAAAVIVTVAEGPASITADFPIPPAQKERMAKGFVSWPDGRFAEDAGIMLEDIRWPWQTSFVSTTTDSRGYFEVAVFDETSYRVHALTMGPGQTISAEPIPVSPASDLSKPLRLVLTRKVHPTAELSGKGLDRWRAGLGL
jgi:hypothetical protein